MKQLTKNQIQKFQKKLKRTELRIFELISNFNFIPQEESKLKLQELVKSNKKEFPILSKMMIDNGLITQKQFDKKWNHLDMYEIFEATLLGKIQKAKDKKDQIVMVTVGKYKLKHKIAIEKTFDVKIRSPQESLAMMKQDNPEEYKKIEREFKFSKKNTNYIG